MEKADYGVYMVDEKGDCHDVAEVENMYLLIADGHAYFFEGEVTGLYPGEITQIHNPFLALAPGHWGAIIKLPPKEGDNLDETETYDATLVDTFDIDAFSKRSLPAA